MLLGKLPKTAPLTREAKASSAVMYHRNNETIKLKDQTHANGGKGLFLQLA